MTTESDGEKPSIEEALRSGLSTRLSPDLRDTAYAALGIMRAAEAPSREIVRATRPDILELLYRVRTAFRRWVPPIYPSDQAYLQSFEGSSSDSISELRESLGYVHYHTRDSILARLRGSLFQEMLFKIEAGHGNPKNESDLVIAFLNEAGSKGVERWREKILGVLRFSLHEEWDEDRQRSAADLILRDILGWFVVHPEVLLSSESSQADWASSVRQDGGQSLASSVLQHPFRNLLLLHQKERSPTDEITQRLLIGSSWFRYFFFEHSALTSWINHGLSGFEREDVFEDFVERLRSRDNWLSLVLPSGLLTDDLSVVEKMREVGRYSVLLESTEKIGVDVSLIPTLSLAEMAALPGGRPTPLSGSLWFLLWDKFENL